jgi:hypothetical protein
MHVTKSHFIRGYDCPMRLRHALDKQPSHRDEDDYLRILAEGGFQFEKLVRASWPGESLRVPGMSQQQAAALSMERVRALVGTGGVLHEAQFVHGDFHARVDTIRIDGTDLLLGEIKAKVADAGGDDDESFAIASDRDVGILKKRGRGVIAQWRDTIADVAFQVVVVERALRAAGLDHIAIHPRLVLASRRSRPRHVDLFGNIRRRRDSEQSQWLSDADFEFETHPGDGVSPLLLEVDVTDAVRLLREESAQSKAESWGDLTIESLMDEMASIARGADVSAASERGWKCRDCAYRVRGADGALLVESGFGACWGDQAEQADRLFDLYYGGDYRPHGSSAGGRWVHETVLQHDGSTPLTIGSLPNDRGGGVRSVARNLQIAAIRHGQTQLSEEFAEIVATRLMDTPWGTESTRHFLDFETATACLPYEVGMRPYEVIAFQFSCHSGICGPDGVDRTIMQHTEWLDPMDTGDAGVRELVLVDRLFVTALREAIGDTGQVLHWSSHERTVLRTIADRLASPSDREHREWIWELAGRDDKSHGRMVDMYQLAQGRIMSPHQSGRYSIKKLLPAACREDRVWDDLCHLMKWSEHRDTDPAGRNPYKLLAQRSQNHWVPDDLGNEDWEAGGVSDGGISCGTDAIRAFQQLRFGVASGWTYTDNETLRLWLKKYCELDTAGMVAIWVWLLHCADRAREANAT